MLVAMTATAPRLLTGTYPLWLSVDTSAQLSSSLGSFAVPLLALAVTGSPTQAGVIGAVGLLGRASSTLTGGTLADRHPRGTLLVIGGITGLLLALALTALSVAHALGFAVLLVLNLALNVRAGLFGPASDAALKDVVPLTALGRAQAANEGRDAVLSLGASPLGGVLLGVGPWLIGAAMTACQVLTTLCALVLRGRLPRGAAAGRAPGSETVPAAAPVAAPDALPDAVPAPAAGPVTPRGLLGALGWMWARRDLRGVLVLSTVVNLGFLLITTTTIYSLQQAGAAPVSIGLVSAGIGAGSLLGSLAAVPLVRRVPAGMLTVSGMALFTLGCAAVPLLNAPLALALVLAVAMLGVPALNAALLGYTMVITPSALLGRVSAVIQTAALGATPLAPLLAGTGLDTVGRTPTLLFGVALCAVATIATCCVRELRRLPAEAEWQAAAV